MSNKSGGGSGCGWVLGIGALAAAAYSLWISCAVGVGSVTDGAVGLPAESHDLAGVLVIVALIALGMARREER